ncbi:uncharacterized protein LOC144107801 isoform X3 [Amblyomma americanum]
MAEKCSPLMDGILSEAESSSGQSAAEDLLVKEGRAAASLKKRLRDLLNEEGSSSDEELVMRKGRGQERETTRAQRRKIRRLETRVDALERKNSRLEDLLVNKLAALISRLSQRGERDPLGNETSGRPAACNCRCACHPETSADKATTSTEPNGNATPALPEVDEQEPHTSAAPAPPRVDKQDLNGNTAPDLPEVDGQVCLGGGVYIPGDRWRRLLGQPKDSLFCREALRLLWSESDLKDRSVTGQPCRRFRKSGGLQGKKALSPVKLRAVAKAYAVFVKKVPSEEPTSQRLNKMNRHIANMIRDLNKMRPKPATCSCLQGSS